MWSILFFDPLLLLVDWSLQCDLISFFMDTSGTERMTSLFSNSYLIYFIIPF